MGRSTLDRVIFAGQFCCLAFAAVYFFGQLNPDAISYLRVSEHLLAGDFALAFNGYWSPLFSWLLVPLLALGLDPLSSVRLLMLLSAMVFSAGAYYLLIELAFPPQVRSAALLAIAFISIPLSYFAVAPDLLMTGGFFFLTARLLRPDWLDSRRRAVWLGCIGGLLYLCKAAALLITVLVLCGVLLLHYWCGAASSRRAVTALFHFGVGLVLFAGPWILLLSLHYGYPTISTVAPIAHAIEGPWDYSPHGEVIPGFSEVLKPAAGRLSTWEDPSYQDFPYWSPFDSARLFKHQLSSIAANVKTNIVYFVFLLAALVVFLSEYRRKKEIHRIAWTVVVVVGANLLVFLPTHAASLRYFLPAAGLLTAVSLHAFAYWLRRRYAECRQSVLLVVALMLAVYVLRPVYGVTLRPFNGGSDYYPIGLRARDLAQELSARRISGPIIGGNPIGFYLSYFMRQPWYGGAEGAAIEDIREVAPRIVLVNGTTWNLRLRRELLSAQDFERFNTKTVDDMTDLGLPEVSIFVEQ